MSPLGFIDGYRRDPLPHGYPDNIRVLYAPVDDIHGAIKAVISNARFSLDVAMYGFDDDELSRIIAAKRAARVRVRMVLDSTQAAGRSERKILSARKYPGDVIAVGRSERGAIMHLKMAVVDNRITMGGSTNWSASGESKQDNELTVIDDPVIAAEAVARIRGIADHINATRTPRLGMAARLAALFSRTGETL